MSERQIHITRQGAQYGPYPESNVKDMLAEGQLFSTDLAWYEGAESWQPLQELLGTKAVETPPPIPQDLKPEERSDDGEQSGKIRVMRNGKSIGPYSWDKAKEHFITGQLLPTDVGCADETGEDCHDRWHLSAGHRPNRGGYPVRPQAIGRRENWYP